MSKVVEHNGTLYLSGLTNDEGDMKEQTAAVLAKAETILNQYGSDKNHILSATIYVKDMALFADMNSVWDAWVEANMARENLLVEISIVAAKK